jgi:Glyoxalase-like domain
MPVSYQLVIDCRSPEPLALFWAAALHYVVAPPPSRFASWEAFYRSVGVPEELIGHGIDRIVDPGGEGPAIWFQVVSEKKVIKNRIHLDINAARVRCGQSGIGSQMSSATSSTRSGLSRAGWGEARTSPTQTQTTSLSRL